MTQEDEGDVEMSQAIVDPNERAESVTDDDELWSTEATAARHKSLATVAAAADGWGKSITAVLGGFALVAFLKGPEAIKDIPSQETVSYTVPLLGWAVDPARAVVLLIFGAAILVILAVLFAALAAQGSPGWTDILDGPTFKEKSESATKSAITNLRVSRILTVLGALLMFVAMSIAWTATIDKLENAEPEAQSAIVVTATGPVCGTIDTAEAGNVVLSVGDTAIPLDGATTIALVESCP